MLFCLNCITYYGATRCTLRLTNIVCYPHLFSVADSTQHDHLAIQLDFIDRVTTRVMVEDIMERIMDLLDMITFYRIDFSHCSGNTRDSGTTSSAVTSGRYKPLDAQSRRIQTLVMFAVAMNHKEYREAEAALKRIAQKERQRGKRVKKIYYS